MPQEPEPPVGTFDPNDELYLNPTDHDGASPGGGLENGTTSGTTGRIVPPGAEEHPIDQAEA